MSRLYHLISRPDLDDARSVGHIAVAPEGFVHLSAAHQVAGTVDRFYADLAGAGELLLLEVDAERLTAVVWEEGEPGVEFPHHYGPLELDVVSGVRVWDEGVRAQLTRSR